MKTYSESDIKAAITDLLSENEHSTVPAQTPTVLAFTTARPNLSMMSLTASVSRKTMNTSTN